jgi:hypothetical protein
MGGNRERLQAPPETTCTSCMIHCKISGYEGIMPRTESSDSCSDKNCKLHKDSSIEKQYFAELCDETWAQYQSHLFYSNSHWLSSGNAVARVYDLRDVVHAEHFRNEYFVTKLA